VLQNPIGVTMPGARKREIAKVLRRLDIWAIEDAIYSFLAPHETRLAREAPERAIVIDSFSKRIAPGLSVGVIVAPLSQVAVIARALRAAAAGPGALALARGGCQRELRRHWRPRSAKTPQRGSACCGRRCTA
jgi:DNA-binding transcriptional MocR family regulator